MHHVPVYRIASEENVSSHVLLRVGSGLRRKFRWPTKREDLLSLEKYSTDTSRVGKDRIPNSILRIPVDDKRSAFPFALRELCKLRRWKFEYLYLVAIVNKATARLTQSMRVNWLLVWMTLTAQCNLIKSGLYL
jgi:hypothetical protein